MGKKLGFYSKLTLGFVSILNQWIIILFSQLISSTIMSYIYLFLKFEIIVDSYAVARNNIERSHVPLSSFPHDNILQNCSTMPQPHFFLV